VNGNGEFRKSEAAFRTWNAGACGRTRRYGFPWAFAALATLAILAIVLYQVWTSSVASIESKAEYKDLGTGGDLALKSPWQGSAITETDLNPVTRDMIHVMTEEPKVRIMDGAANLLNLIDVGFANKPVTEAARTLQELLDFNVRLSAGAQKTVTDKVVTLSLGEVTGAEALAALAQIAGLVVQIREGDVVLELPGEETKKWTEPESEEF